jgi:hypothetical protein
MRNPRPNKLGIIVARMTQQPNACPAFRCLPPRVKGMPIAREIFPFAAEIPTARFQENENPNFLPIAIRFDLR